MVDEAAFAVSRPGLRHDGKLVRVAVPVCGTIRALADGTVRAPVHGTIRGGIPVTGSGLGTRQDLAEVLRPHAPGPTGSGHGTRPLASVDQPTDEVPRGRDRTGIVLDPGTGR
ncbi:hypothetical protein [Streptomyces sp. NBC_01176]|uniref:hypothetical protein n=1 Tax=Streptomyces sp. NBC_01176 TaxID=2903760 RepID=UPI00386F299C|nr:hypothetical protein OG199_36605 [Streptomyces sp. NBC_01176]